MGITQIYAQCYQCNGTAFSIGYNTTAEGLASFAGGNASNASGSYSFAFGDNAKAIGDYSIAFGNNANVFQADGIAIGSFVTSNAVNSYVFGMGSSGLPLTNDKPNSIMFGVNEFPSLTIHKPTGATKGYLGIGTDEPTEMAHVVGKLLIDRTEETASSLQFKHPNTRGDVGQGGPGGPTPAPYYWDIYSDHYGLRFNTKNYSNSITSSIMVISSNGRVGIGIETPQAKLHVNQNILAEGNITTLNKFVFAPTVNASEYWEISRTSAGLKYGYYDRTLKDVLFIGNDGFIGIGKTTPSATLDVNGSFKAASANISGTLSANALNAENATIDNLLGDVNVSGVLNAPKVRITELLCAKEVLVRNNVTCWPDYVFNKEYQLTPLNELEQFITENQHLPNVPSAAEVEANGVELGEMNALLLQKVEELTLYIIQLEKRLSEIESKKGGE